MNISIILAAGEGTRMKSKKSKVLHRICNKPILEYVVESSKGANVDKHIIVVGDNHDQISAHYKDGDMILKKQPIGEEYPYGTGYAIMQAEDEIDENSTVLILYGDTPLIRSNTIEDFMAFHKSENMDATVLTAVLEDPTDYGRIVRNGDGNISKIVEERDTSETERKIKEVNSGIYCFDGGLLKKALKKLTNDNAQKEYYATDLIEILKNSGYRVGAYIMEDSREIHGINSRSQLAFCEKIMRERINLHHMDNGVTIIDPDRTYIEPEVVIGQDTIVYPGVFLEGNTKIGQDCLIRQDSRIANSILEDNVVVESSIIENSILKNCSKIGPYTHIRPNSEIGENVGLGNFVEVKNSKIGEGTKAAHLSYIGDADLGRDINVGCGTIFVNYNGKEKHRTKVGDEVFIGCNSNLIAPLDIEDSSFIAAGSTIDKKVAKGSLAIGRARQVNYDGWMEKNGYRNK